MAGEYGYWREKRLYNSKLGPASNSDSSFDDNSSKKSKRQVKVSTFDMWKRDMDRDYKTLTWLCHEVDKKTRLLVSSLYCKVAMQDKILSLRNFSSVWINGSYNHRTNNIVDHAQSEQHKVSMDHMLRVYL